MKNLIWVVLAAVVLGGGYMVYSNNAVEEAAAAEEAAGGLADLPTPEGFNLDKVGEIIDGSELAALKKIRSKQPWTEQRTILSSSTVCLSKSKARLACKPPLFRTRQEPRTSVRGFILPSLSLSGSFKRRWRLRNAHQKTRRRRRGRNY